MSFPRGLTLPLGVFGLLLFAFPMLASFVRQSIYPAPSLPVPSPPPAPLEEVRLDSATGERISGWTYTLPGLPPPAPAAVFFHGNGENLETMRRAGILDDLTRLGIAWLAVDYPGYGRSSGRPSEEGLVAAAEASIDWMRKRHPARPLVLCGWSLGAATALAAAARHPGEVRGLILLSPWTSLPDVARVHFPDFLVNGILRERYGSLAAAQRIHVPALVIHGEQDTIIPAEQGRRVAEALAGPVRWRPVPRAGHNDLLIREEVWKEMDRFLAEVASAASENP